MLTVLAAIPLAIVDLARARLVLARLRTPELAQRNRAAADVGRSPREALPGDADAVHLVGHVYLRVAQIVPWRSDCLVQALAAQHRLAARRIASEIVIGVDKTDTDGFSSHAWLRYGNHIVTGGVVDRYAVILDAGGH